MRKRQLIEPGDIRSESDVRRWLRERWPKDWGPLIWVEAARGGTVGAPDVFVPTVTEGFIPIELKYWPRESLTREEWRYPAKTFRDGKRFKVNAPVYPKVEIRPAQARLHSMISSCKLKSAILAYISFGEFVIGRASIVASTKSVLSMQRISTVEELEDVLTMQSTWIE